MTCLFFENGQLKHKNKSVSTTTPNRVNFHNLNARLLHENWSEVYSEDNPSLAFDLFLKILNGHSELCSEAAVVKRKKLEKLQPWMSNYLLQKI